LRLSRKRKKGEEKNLCGNVKFWERLTFVLPTWVEGPGLPDGIFSNQKSQFGSIWEGLAIEDVGIFYGHLVQYIRGHLVYFMAIWYIFFRFGMLHQE
jgi:hypothetical protein